MKEMCKREVQHLSVVQLDGFGLHVVQPGTSCSRKRRSTQNGTCLSLFVFFVLRGGEGTRKLIVWYPFAPSFKFGIYPPATQTCSGRPVLQMSTWAGVPPKRVVVPQLIDPSPSLLEPPVLKDSMVQGSLNQVTLSYLSWWFGLVVLVEGK